MIKCIFLAGAPESSKLSWDKSGLKSDFDSPVKRLLNSQPGPSLSDPSSPASRIPKWRAVSMTGKSYDASESTPAEKGLQTQFLSFDDGATNGREKMEFLQQSLAHLKELESSQIVPVAEDTTFISTSFGSASDPNTYESYSTASFQGTQEHPASAQHQVLNTCPITDLKRVPHADHLLRVVPQTITENFLAAVISVLPSRTVRLRKSGSEMDIIELLLGDDTRAGFRVCFWIASVDSQRKDQDDMRSVLHQLRTGDVVLLQNIALAAFKGLVYGQSISRRFAKNSTTLHVIGEGRRALAGGMQNKYRRVCEWALDFVGRDGGRSSSTSQGLRRSGRRQKENLPPDTQPSQST